MKTKSLKEFFRLLNSEAPTPGGGAVIAYVSALAVGLTNMSALISKKRKSFSTLSESVQSQVNTATEKLTQYGEEMLDEIQKDVDGFNCYMEALKLPKESSQQIKQREEAINKAAKSSILLPYHVLEICLEAFNEFETILPIVASTIISDLAIGIILIDAAVESCIVNLKINLPYIHDTDVIDMVKNKINEATNVIEYNIRPLKDRVLLRLN